MAKEFVNQAAQTERPPKPVRRSYWGVAIIVAGCIAVAIGIINSAGTIDGDPSGVATAIAGVGVIVSGLVIGIIEKIYSVLIEINTKLSE